MYTRANCGLCEAMLDELTPWLRERGSRVEAISIDSDSDLRRRYGERVPVLVLEGEEICFGRLELDLLEEAWSATR